MMHERVDLWTEMWTRKPRIGLLAGALDEHMNSLKVGVVLVNWNTSNLTWKCIQSLLNSDRPPDRIIVVDNASTDAFPEEVLALSPRVELIKSTENIGFAAACNVGTRAMLLGNMDVIWLLNNDTVVDKECLRALLEELESSPEAGVVSGKILFSESNDIIWYAGSFWKSWSFEPAHAGSCQKDTGQFEQPCDVPFVSGCCMAIRRSAFVKVGLFDERYFAYFEDADWSLRAGSAGISMRYQPRAIIWHHAQASVHRNTFKRTHERVSPLFMFLILRNHLFLIRQHANRPWQMCAATLRVFWNAMRVALRLLILCRWTKLRWLLRAIGEGLSAPVCPQDSNMRHTAHMPNMKPYTTLGPLHIAESSANGAAVATDNKSSLLNLPK